MSRNPEQPTADDGKPQVNVQALAFDICRDPQRAATMVATRDIRAMAAWIEDAHAALSEMTSALQLMELLGNVGEESKEGVKNATQSALGEAVKHLVALGYMEVRHADGTGS